jgi:hypothetical protein
MQLLPNLKVDISMMDHILTIGQFLQAMGRVLSAEGCQIIRLALIGNAIGDAGMVTMSKSLQVTPHGKITLHSKPVLMCALCFTRVTRH